MINAALALGLLQNQVTKKGDSYVYKAEERANGEDPDCEYFDLETGEPSCIVGYVFEDLNLSANSRINTNYNHSGVNTVIDDLLSDTFTDGAVDVLVAAQDVQDLGGSWGEALIAAKEAYASLEPESV